MSAGIFAGWPLVAGQLAAVTGQPVAPAIGLPGAPILGPITVGDAQFTIASITPPADNGGQAIVDYIVYGVQPDNNFKAIGTYTPAQIANPIVVTKYSNNSPIVNGTVIKIVAAARNGFGGPAAEGARSNVRTITPTVGLMISGTDGSAQVGSTASFTPTISGGTAPYTVVATGLPPGRAIQDASTGLTTGAYTTAGSYSVTYTVTDSVGATAAMTRTVVVGAASVAPTAMTLSNSAVQSTAAMGSDIGTLSSDAPDAKFRIVSNNGYASVSGKRVRLEQAPQALSITVEAYNSAGTYQKTFPLTVIPKTMPAGMKFRFDTLDATKVTVVSGKVTQWVDKISGFTLAQATAANQPTWDTTNTAPNGAPGLTTAPTAVMKLDATADAVNDPLKAFLNAADQPYTILALVKTVAAPASARVLMSIGNLDSTKPGGAKYYFSWRQAAGIPGMAIARADTTGGPAAVSVGTPNPAPSGITMHAIRSNGANTFGTIDKVDGSQSPTGLDGAVVANAFSLFNLAQNPQAASTWEGQLYGIIGFDRFLSQDEVFTAMDLFGADFNKTYGAAPTILDITKYTLVTNEDFDGDTIPMNPTKETDYTAPTGFIPYYPQAQVREHGSTSALGDERGFLADPRHPAIAPYKDQLYSQADGILTLGAIPMPAAIPSAGLNINNGDGNPCTQLTAGFVTLGDWRFSKQGAYYETRVKQAPAAVGRVGADWAMPADTRWPTEVDSHENLFPTDDNRRCANLHSDPYGPNYGGGAQDLKMPIYAQVPSLSGGFALYGWQVRDDGIYIWHNRVLIGKMDAYNGAMAVSVTNGGSGIKLANGTLADGTLRLRAATTWPFAFATDAIADATVVGGVITAVTVIKPGTRPSNVWLRDTVMTGGTAGSLAFQGTTDPTFTTTFSVDPVVAPQYHTPFYLLFGQQMWNGVAAGDSAQMQIDYIRVYEENIAAPALASSTPARAQAVIDRASALGSAFSSAKQTRIINGFKALEAWKLRTQDPLPMGSNTGFAIHTSDWDVTKVSLADALEDLYIFDTIAPDAVQARINWAKPIAANDLALIGSPSLVQGTGYSLTAADGIQSPSVAGSNLVRGNDNHLGAHISGLAADSTLRRHVGTSTVFGLYSSTTTHETRLMNTGGMINAGSIAQPLPDGHYIGVRGWRYRAGLYKDGALHRPGYFAAYNGVTTGVGALVAGQTVPMTIRKLHTGRRLMPKEIAKLTEILAGL